MDRSHQEAPKVFWKKCIRDNAFQKSKFAAEQAQRERQFKLQERRLALQESKAQSGGSDIPKDSKTKELVVTLPPDALAQVGWDFGDELEWKINPLTHQITLEKKK